MKLGADFGTVPFGTHQIEAHHAAAGGCTCDPTFVRLGYVDVRCPVHGLEAHLREIVRRIKAEEAAE